MTRDPNDPAAIVREQEIAAMSEEVLASLGAGIVAYVREVQAKDLAKYFPEAPPTQDTTVLWALLNADGTPILVADSREAALANAFEHDLEMVSLH
ncbi:BQ00720 family protein [Roseibium suaedae]|uniref:DUF1150 domain-containing protein n=1 Tax=Roseibium suaedae TaxID=735517 RepID=A0A1M6ZH93_9HYPH|nr:DUF1150 domain-containing protein [Roseibium suaedae]SHL29856.1 hypothetical protein SAMN05444272_0242 [Roseibium suaedae]